jgi:HAD superfamily hydrolase (TIGR01450 family)
VTAIPPIRPEALVARYEVLLLDAYGVLVDHARALPGATGFLDRVRAAGRRMLVVSNDASRLPKTAADRFARLGLPISEDEIVMSGEALVRFYRERGLAGRRTVVLGPPDSIAWVERAGGRPVAWDDPSADPEVIVVADDDGYPFLPGIEAAIAHAIGRLDAGRPIELVLPNPDLVYPKGPGALGLTAGSVALLVEQALAQRYPGDPPRFHALGKPHTAIFEVALERLGVTDRARVVMIGDQLETDIRGAAAAGIDSVLVQSGVAGSAPAGPSGPRPTFVMPALG